LPVIISNRSVVRASITSRRRSRKLISSLRYDYEFDLLVYDIPRPIVLGGRISDEVTEVGGGCNDSP